MYGKAITAGDKVVLPKFVQDAKFAKEVLGYLFKGNEHTARLAAEIVKSQASWYKYLKYGVDFPADVQRRMQFIEQQRELYKDEFEYDPNSITINNEYSFLKSLIFSDYGTPVAEAINIMESNPRLKGRKRVFNHKNAAGEIIHTAEQVAHGKSIYNEGNKQGSFDDIW